MKKILGPLVLGIVIGAAVLYLVLGRPALPRKASAGKTSFDRVAAQLETGGELFVYYSLERIFPLVDDIIRTVAEALPGEAEKKAASTDQVLNVIKKLGLREIDGLGLSSVTVDKDLYRTRAVVHHPSDKGQGLIWSFLSRKERDFEILRQLPAETVLAAMADIQIEKLWDWLKTSFPQGPSQTPSIAQGLADLEAKGIPLEKMIVSLQGPFGYVLTLDPQKKLKIPAAGPALEIPEPGLAIVLTVKDSAIFDFLKNRIPGASYAEKDGVRRLQIAALPFPLPLSPTVLLKNNLLVAATTESLADLFIGAGTGNKLTETKGFRSLSRGVPFKGAAFSYLGPGLMTAILDIAGKATPPKKEPAGPDPAAILRKIFPADLELLSVVQHGAEGFVSITNHTVPMEKLYLLQLAPLLSLPLTSVPGPAKLITPQIKF